LENLDSPESPRDECQALVRELECARRVVGSIQTPSLVTVDKSASLQTLKDKWLNADVAAKRQLLEIVCLNFRLDGATLVPAIRKPFDVLAEGLLVSYSRGDGI